MNRLVRLEEWIIDLMSRYPRSAGFATGMLIVFAILALTNCGTVPDEIGGVPVPRIDDTLDAALMTPEERCAEGKRLLATIPDPTRQEKALAITACLQ